MGVQLPPLAFISKFKKGVYMKIQTKEIKLEDISQTEKKLTVEIDNNYFKNEIEKTYKDIIKNATIKGFRPGKAPRSIIERLYGENIKEEVIHRIEKEFIEEYLEENKIDIVSRIHSDHSFNGENLRYEFKFEVKPLIAPSNYRGIEVKGKETSVTDEEVNSIIDEIIDKYARLLPPDKDVVEENNYVKLVVVSHKDSKMVNKPIYLELNNKKTKKFIIDALIGKKLNEEVELKVSEESEEKMKVKIEEIRKIERPEVNDEFVKNTLQMESVDALKKDIQQKIKERKENAEKESRFENIIKEIIARNPFPIPPSMVERAVENYVHDMEHSSNRKFSKEEHDALVNSSRESITYEIQKYLIMEAIGRLEGIDVDDNDVEAHFKKISDETGENVIKVKAYYEKNNLIPNLKEDLKMSKIKDFLINEAKITIEQ